MLLLLLAWSLADPEVVAAEDDDATLLLLTLSLQLQPHLA